MIDLAWPTAVAMLGDTAMGLVDTKLVSGLGAAALGGVGVATTIMWLNYSIVFGLMRGVKVRTAHAHGEGRPEDGLAYVRAGTMLALLLGTTIWLLSRDATWAFVKLGIDPATVPYARDFLAARTFGAVSICLISAFVQYRQGAGDSRMPMLGGLLANAINAPLAWALIYGHFGLPALGVTGAGYATATAETVEMLFLGWVVLRARRDMRASGRPVSLLSPGSALREVSQLGVPTGTQFGLELLAFTAFTAIIGSLGAAEIAAHQVAMAVIRTSFLPGVAVAEAASVLVGKSLGERNLAKADEVTRTSIVLAAGFMTVCGVVFAIFGGRLAAQFAVEGSDVHRIVRRLLLVAAIFQTLDAVTIVLRGALRGAKDVRVVAMIGVGVAWVCIPGAAFVLGKHAGFGAVGGWFGFVAETTIAASLFWLRWSRGTWRADYAPRKVEAVSSPEPLAQVA
ncbi:MAG: MATE family efflux transporter [Polyangiales bacterium]